MGSDAIPNIPGVSNYSAISGQSTTVNREADNKPTNIHAYRDGNATFIAQTVYGNIGGRVDCTVDDGGQINLTVSKISDTLQSNTFVDISSQNQSHLPPHLQLSNIA